MTDYPYQDEVRYDVLRMVPPDGRVIGTIGCGTAATEAPLVVAGREVHGVDIDAPSIEVAKGRLTSARTVSPDDPAPFAAGSLDGLILADVIEHLPAAWERLRLFADAVRPGGWVVISVPNMRSMTVLRRFVWGGDWPEHPMGVFDRTHLQVMSKARLLRWCDAAGLELECWFDSYDPQLPRWQNTIRRIDRATLGLFHEWLMFQLQGRFRKRR